MASSGDKTFWSHGRSKAQMSVGKILNAISAASAPPNSPWKQSYRDEGLEREAFVEKNVEKRRLLNIDLNVAPSDDGGSDSPAADDGGDRFVVVNDEAKETKTIDTINDSEVEKERKDRGWITLLNVAENALNEFEEKSETQKRRASQEIELGGELTTRKRRNGHSEAAAPVVVVRSTRGRAVAMPNKYRDSVLDAVAEAEFSRHNKNGKSATMVSNKRKFR